MGNGLTSARMTKYLSEVPRFVLGFVLFAFGLAGLLHLLPAQPPMEGPAGLRAAILKNQRAFVLSFTESLMTYALGRRVEAYDMPLVRQIIRDAAANGYKMQTFVQGVVASQAFRMSRVAAPETTTTAPAAAGNHR